jgi:hypothetical protein
MYTKLDDERQAKFVRAYLEKNPHCIIKDVIQDCVMARSRLKYLEQQGLIRLPDPTPRQFRNGLKWKEGINNEVSISM